MKMSLEALIADYIGIDSFILVIGAIIALTMVLLVTINNNRKWRRQANILTMAVSVFLLGSILIYPKVMERAYIGKPDFECQVYERDDNGDIIYIDQALINPETGEKLVDIQGNVVTEKFPKLKPYFFPLQDITLQDGILKIRIQSSNVHNVWEERYCAFDIFPNDKETTTAEQEHVREWYKQLQQRKKQQDQANALEEIAEMSEEEIEGMAEDIAGDEAAEQRSEQAQRNMDALGDSIAEQNAQRQAEQDGEGNGSGEQGEAEQGQGEQGQQGPKGRSQPGNGFGITLPATGEERRALEDGEQEGEPRTGYEADTNNPANQWDTSNSQGNLIPSEEERELKRE